MQQELREHASELRSHPVRLTLDPSTACNLKCPFCPTGAGYGSLAKRNLSRDDFYRIVSHLRIDLLQEAALYNWGEPLLNPHIAEFARFFSEHEIPTSTSTNFSQRDFDESFLESLVTSGLNLLIISIDGVDQSTYQKYRVGGSLKRVVANAQRLARVKRTLGVGHPVVTFKMLLNRFNQHQVEAMRTLADDSGADFILDRQFWCPADARAEWIADELRQGNDEANPLGVDSPTDAITTYCRQLWDEVIVNSDGEVFPCCLVYEPQHRVGNLVHQKMSQIRNCDSLVYLRKFVVDPERTSPPFANHCAQCSSRYCTVQKAGLTLRKAWT